MGRNQACGGFPGLLPVRGPLGDKPRVIRLAAVYHLGHGASKCHKHRILLQFAIAVGIERPLDLDIGVSLEAIVPSGFDCNVSNPGTDIDGYKGVACLMVCRDFGQDRRAQLTFNRQIVKFNTLAKLTQARYGSIKPAAAFERPANAQVVAAMANHSTIISANAYPG